VSPLRIRNAEPREYGRVGDLTIAAYAALPVDHLWGGYADEIRDVAGRAAAGDVLVAVDHTDDAVLGALTLVTDPTSPWLEWTEPGEVQSACSRSTPRRDAPAPCGECRARRRPVLIHTTQWLEAAQRLYAFGRPPPDRDAVRGVARPRKHDLPRNDGERFVHRLAQLMYR
jgi:hypothetical protein